MVITRVAPLSIAKIAGLLYLILGLIFGAIVSLLALAGGMASGEEEGAFFGALFGVGAVVMLPIVYACLGFVMTLIMAALFNVAAGITGGVEIDAR
jgi:hypothetical protein